jgi:hypothetical protein
MLSNLGSAAGWTNDRPSPVPTPSIVKMDRPAERPDRQSAAIDGARRLGPVEQRSASVKRAEHLCSPPAQRLWVA